MSGIISIVKNSIIGGNSGGSGGGGNPQPSSSSLPVEDSINESLSGTAITQQEINKENKEKILDLETNSHKTTGFFSSTAPSGADKGNLWFQTNADDDNGSDLPVNFPIQVKIYKNGSWSSTTQNYTSKNGDIWANLNNHHEYYWMAGNWNWTDATKPNLNPNQLEYNNANQVSIKNNAVDENLLATDITDNNTLEQDLTTNVIKVKQNGITNNEVADNTITFAKINSNSVANGLENASNKIVKANDLYNNSIASIAITIKIKTGGGKELEIDLKNTAGISITKSTTDIDETATQDSNNLITSNAVYKEELNSPNSSQECSFNPTTQALQLTTQLKNNNNDLKVNKTTELLEKETDYSTLTDSDEVSKIDLSTKKIKNVSFTTIFNWLLSKLTGAISSVLTTNLTSGKILKADENGKIADGYDLVNNADLNSTDLQITTAKQVVRRNLPMITGNFDVDSTVSSYVSKPSLRCKVRNGSELIIKGNLSFTSQLNYSSYTLEKSQWLKIGTLLLQDSQQNNINLNYRAIAFLTGYTAIDDEGVEAYFSPSSNGKTTLYIKRKSKIIPSGIYSLECMAAEISLA